MNFEIQILHVHKFTLVDVQIDNFGFSGKETSIVARDTFGQSTPETQYKIGILNREITRTISKNTNFTHIIITEITPKVTHNIWKIVVLNKLLEPVPRFG